MTVILLAVGWYGPSLLVSDDAPGLSLLQSTQSIKDSSEWRQADPNYIVSLPADHGPHKDFQTEWWYLVMHLTDDQGERYAAQWTVFRQALPPLKPATQGPWQYQHHYLGHLSWLPPGATRSNGQHINLRGSPSLAGSSTSRVWCGPMSLAGLDQSYWELVMPAGNGDLELTLEPSRPAILHGQDGYSAKDDNEAASHYYSYSRMTVRGSWRHGDTIINLSGFAWFDHEWFSGGLGRQLGGWDWWCWRLDNGDDLMLGWLRDPDGNKLPDFTGTWRRNDGTITKISARDIQQSDVTWWNTEQGRRYPVARILRVGPYHVRIEPWVESQYHQGIIPYWEGAVDLIDVETGRPIGVGFQELTGY